MRRTKLLFLCSLIAPGSASLAACFGSSEGTGTNGGVIDSGTGGIDAGLADTGQPGQSDTGPAPGPDATGPASGIIPQMVDLGVVGCGAPASSQTFTVTNIGLVPVTYSATVANSTVFAISGASSGTVAPGATGSLTLTATVPAAATAGTPLTGQLTVTTNVPGYTTVQVPLTVMPGGGSLALSPATAGFGQVQIGTVGKPVAIALTNTGNQAIGVSLGTPTDPEFSVKYTGSPTVMLQPGASLSGAFAGFTPTSAGDKSATSAITTTGTMCASSVTALPLTGSGTTAAVTVGPSPLDYGTFTCGTANPAMAQAVTVGNNYTFAITYTATLGKGASSPYTIDAPTGTVPASASTVIHVAPAQVSLPATVNANGYGDILTVTTNAPGVPPATVTLNQSASGAILGINMPKAGFGLVPINAPVTLPFTVVNSGNVDAPVTLGIQGSAWSEQTVGSTAKANGGSVPGTVTFKPADTTAQSTSLTVSTNAPLCAVTAPQTVTGQGQSSDASFPGGPFTVETTCGGASAGTQTLTITNHGTTPLVLSSIGSSNGYLQIVSAPTAPIAPGASNFIVFQARDAVIGTDAAGSYPDAVAFTTNETGNPTHAVPVTVVIHGANLSFSSNPIVDARCGSRNFGYSVDNSGDLDAVVSALSPYPFSDSERFSYDGTFEDPGTTVPAGENAFDTVFISGGACLDSDSVTFSSTGNVCIPLPVLTVSVDAQICSSSGSTIYCYCPCET